MPNSAPNHSHEPAFGKGVTFALFSLFFMNVNNALLKWLSGSMPTMEIMFFRSAVIVAIILVIAARRRKLPEVNNWRGHFLWGGIQFFNGIVFIMGVGYLPLADTIAITFSGPLFLTLLATPLLGEYIGWRRWAAVIVGFLGIIIITRPTGDAFQWVVLFPLAAALSGALRDITSRKVTAHESSLSILFTSSLIGMAGSLVAMPFGWIIPTPDDIGFLIAIGLCVCIGLFLMIDAYRYAEAKVLAPLRYTAIIWSVILGYLLWGDLPDGWTVAGTAVVIVSGLYILRREYQETR